MMMVKMKMKMKMKMMKKNEPFHSHPVHRAVKERGRERHRLTDSVTERRDKQRAGYAVHQG